MKQLIQSKHDFYLHMYKQIEKSHNTHIICVIALNHSTVRSTSIRI